MAKPLHHFLDIYSAHLHLATDEKGWARLRRDFTDQLNETPDALGLTTFTTFVPNDPGETVAHLFLFVDLQAHRGIDVALVETCTHEAVHAATHLLMHYGHKVRRHDEPFAYLTAWISQWMYAHCARRAG